MFAALLRKEILSNLYNQRYVITLVLLTVLIGVSVWTLERAQRIYMDQYAEAKLGRQEEMSATEKVWQLFGSGVTREKRPGDMSVIARGLEPELTRSLTYSGWDEVETGAPKEFSPLFRMFSPPDFIYIINVIGSLLALLFVYDAVCGEKEQGTLRLNLTYPLPRDYILLAKWMGGILSLCLPLALVTLGMAVYLFYSPGFELSLDCGIRLAMVFGLSIIYLSVFFTLGLLVSCLTHRSTTSLMICLFLWILLVLTIPNLMPMIARGVKPIPSEGKIAIEKIHKRREVEEWAGKTIRTDIHDEDEYRDTVDRLIAKAFEGITQFRRNRVQEQMNLAMNLSRISPSSCYLFSSTDLTRTGISSFVRFQRYVLWYRELFNVSKDRIRDAARERAEDGAWWQQDLQPSDLQEIARFKALETPFAESMRNIVFDISILLTYNVVLFLAAYCAFLRYDVK